MHCEIEARDVLSRHARNHLEMRIDPPEKLYPLKIEGIAIEAMEQAIDSPKTQLGIYLQFHGEWHRHMHSVEETDEYYPTALRIDKIVISLNISYVGDLP